MIWNNYSGSLLPSNLLLMLLISGVIIYNLKPANSSAGSSLKEEYNTANDTKVEELWRQILQREGYSNPNSSVNECPNESRRRIVKYPPGITRRTPVKIDANFNPNSSYVRIINGTCTYVPPLENWPASTTIRTTTTTATLEPAQPYPTEQINAFMSQYGQQFHAFFGNDTLPRSRDEQLNNRVMEMTGRFFCDGEPSIVHPTSGFLKNGTKILVVNTNVFHQGLLIEECRNVGQQCKLEKRNGTRCEQSYNYRRVLVKHPVSEEFYMEHIRLASGCKCAYLKC